MAQKQREKDPQLYPDTLDAEIFLKLGVARSMHMSDTIYTCMFWLLSVAYHHFPGASVARRASIACWRHLFWLNPSCIMKYNASQIPDLVFFFFFLRMEEESPMYTIFCNSRSHKQGVILTCDYVDFIILQVNKLIKLVCFGLFCEIGQRKLLLILVTKFNSVNSF